MAFLKLRRQDADAEQAWMPKNVFRKAIRDRNRPKLY
jgi:hypothetical protein